MDRNVLESQWSQIRELLSEKFSNLTDEDIRQINGRYDQLVAKLQQKYGYTKEEAEDRIRSWNFDRFATSAKNPTTPTRETRNYREDKVENRDTFPPFLKWLLALGIPLLLLGTYFLSQDTVRRDGVMTPASSQEQVTTESSSDRVFADGLRRVLLQQNLASDLQNVQIISRNGVVTLSGTVPSREARDSIINTTQAQSGVKQVINNLQVR